MLPDTQIGIYCLEVGQGDSHLIVQTRGGVRHGVLIDGGPPETGRALLKFVRETVDHLDAVILTHNDEDHAGGLAPLLVDWGEKSRITDFWALLDRDLGKMAAVGVALTLEGKRKLALKRLERHTEAPRMVSTSLSEVVLSVLHPTFAKNLLSRKNPNRTSGALQLSLNGQGIALWLGDLPAAEAGDVVSRERARAKLLVVPHHGSGENWTKERLQAFFGHVHPSFVVISVGTGNRYGHPSKLWIDQALAGSACVMCTQMTPECDPSPARVSHIQLQRHNPRLTTKGTACAGTTVFAIDERGDLILKYPLMHRTFVGCARRSMCT